MPDEYHTRATNGRKNEDKDSGCTLLMFFSAIHKGQEEDIEKTLKQDETEALAAHPLSEFLFLVNLSVVKIQPLSSESSDIQPLSFGSWLPPPEGNIDL